MSNFLDEIEHKKQLLMEATCKNKLDQILLSQNVTENFYNAFKHDQTFHKWLSEKLPELVECERQQQNNPWHKYNVLGHILHSVEEMNKQTEGMPQEERRKLAYVMLFHDIGKPATHITRQKDGKTIDSFFGHNVKSCEIAQRCLPSFDFGMRELVQMSQLIYKHDIFMFIKDHPTNNPHWKQLSFQVLEKEIADLSQTGDGHELMRQLVMVGRADNLAQNEKMTAPSLAMLDKIDTMLDEMDREKE